MQVGREETCLYKASNFLVYGIAEGCVRVHNQVGRKLETSREHLQEEGLTNNRSVRHDNLCFYSTGYKSGFCEGIRLTISSLLNFIISCLIAYLKHIVST